VNEEKIESMLSQLIKMVGNIQTEQKEMKQELKGMKQEQVDMKQDQKNMQEQLQEFEKKAEERHKEILERFTAIETDQDFIWSKTARNEREIAHIKGRLR
jgi:peptidoglycan hydrolase CwlO-like protein